MPEATPPSPFAQPSLTEEPAPFQVYVKQPPRRRYWLHALLFALTVFTTLVVGARLEFYFRQGLPAFSLEDTGLSEFPLFWILHNPGNLMLGIPFAATLLGILGAHEMGHYIYCRRYGVYATLPYFIPAPTLIGTLGAVIRIKGRIPSRQALFDIGIAGPIAGFIVAVPMMLLGLARSRPLPAMVEPPGLELGFPLIFHLGHVLRLPAPLSQLLLHPIAIAAWFGMFATALNLLPGGQLDGGHIVWGISPRAHRAVSVALMLALIPMAVFGFLGWLIWAAFVRFSMRHPYVPVLPELDSKRRLLAAVALLMLLLTLAPRPFQYRNHLYGQGSLIDIVEQIRHGG